MGLSKHTHLAESCTYEVPTSQSRATSASVIDTGGWVDRRAVCFSQAGFEYVIWNKKVTCMYEFRHAMWAARREADDAEAVEADDELPPNVAAY